MKNFFSQFFTVAIQGLKGLNNQGSSRRLTAFYFTFILITALDAAYIYMGIKGTLPAPFEAILDAHLYFTSALFFATTTENITKNFTKKNEKPADTTADSAHL